MSPILRDTRSIVGPGPAGRMWSGPTRGTAVHADPSNSVRTLGTLSPVATETVPRDILASAKLASMNALSRRGHKSFFFLTVILVSLFLICLTSLAEAAAPACPVCAGVNCEEVSASKTSSSILWAVPVKPSIPLCGVTPSGRFSLDPTPNHVCLVLFSDLSSRAPPKIL